MLSDFATVFGCVVVLLGFVFVFLIVRNPVKIERLENRVADLEEDNADLEGALRIMLYTPRAQEQEPDDLELYGGAQTFSTPFDAMMNGTPAPDGSGIRAVMPGK